MMIEPLLIVFLGCCVVVLVVLLYRSKHTLDGTRRENYVKQAFLHNISNEIRIPLKAIDVLSQTVSKEDLYLSKTEKRNIADQLQYNVSLINTLFDEVMVFTDNEAEGHRLKDDLFSPNELCRRCLEANMYSIYHRQDVKMGFKRELSDEYFVKSDRHVVELILNKLIVNACRFTEEGSITVGCNTNEYAGWLTVFVNDTGVGIPENRIEKLFSWFESPVEGIDAAELDLSICQRLAEKLGGKMVMDANYNRQGTRMLLLLPLK